MSRASAGHPMVHFRLPRDLIKAVDHYRIERDLSSRAAAVEELLERAMDLPASVLEASS